MRLVLVFALALPLIADPVLDRMRTLTERLCQESLEGRVRGTAGAKRAAAEIADAFAAAGLQPFEGSSLQHTFDPGDGNKGINVIGWIPGREASSPIVVIAAHYDGEGYVGGHLTPGAEHNASAVAVMAEAARELREDGAAPGHAVLFAALDYGIAERQGASALLETVGRERVAAMIDLEVIGGDPIPGLKNKIFALGGESSGTIDAALAQASGSGLDVIRGGIYLIEGQGPRGGYDVFRAAKIPFLYLSSGITKHFDKPTDTADKLNYEKMAATANFVAALVTRLDARAVGEIESVSSPPSHHEARGVLDMVRMVLEARAELGLNDKTVEALKRRAESIEELLAADTIPERKRSYLQKTLEQLVVIINQAP